MSRVNLSRKKNCDVKFCDAHYGRRKRGDHIRADLIIPVPGRMEAVVFRRLGQDGSRDADMLLYAGAGTWTPAPLPRRPRKAYADAVRRARQFLKTGALS